MKIEIPGYITLDLKYLILDYNGTIAIDGIIPDSVKERICELSKELDIYVLTADTHGTAAQMCEGLPVTIRTFPTDNAMSEKLSIMNELDAEKCIAIGNGRNDLLMCREAGLSVAIIGREGAYGKMLTQVHVCVTSIEDGLDLFLKPKRLIATLRG